MQLFASVRCGFPNYSDPDGIGRTHVCTLVCDAKGRDSREFVLLVKLDPLWKRDVILQHICQDLYVLWPSTNSRGVVSRTRWVGTRRQS